MEKKLNIWNDYQNQKNYDLSFKTVEDNPPDHIILKETKDDRGKNGTEWEFKIVSKVYIDTKNAEQDETARQQQAQITEHSHTFREHEEKIVKVEEKNTEQDNKLSEIENKNTEQDNKLSEIENKNTEQDGKLTEHENRLEQLDGGHTSNLGKIGEIETTLDDHKGRLELLETETETYNTRVYKKNLSPMELKLDNVLSLVKATISIYTKSGETFTSHLSGLYIVDKKNSHNNILNLLTDSKDNEKFYHIELSGDESFLVKIIHTKNIEITNVLISEYSQTLLEIPLLDGIEKKFLPKFYVTNILQGYSSTEWTAKINIFSKTNFIKFSENITIFEVNALIHLNIKKLDNFSYFEIRLGDYLNEYFTKERIPKYYGGDYTEEELFERGSMVLVNNSKLVKPVLQTQYSNERFEDLHYNIPKEHFNEGINLINLRLIYYYDSTARKKGSD